MEIKYLFHSGFKIETEKKIIIFDYFKDNCAKARNKDCGHCCEESLGKDKELYFFVSHAHYDHYDKSIFDFKNTKQYFISEDLKLNDSPKITFCKPYSEYVFDDLKIKTFGSTDEGVSFHLNVEGVNIFHAGDLNWWHWEGENSEEKEYAEKAFFKEMSMIEGIPVDIAMFPVDPRLERAYCFGGKVFIEKIKPKVFIPMHFLDAYDVTRDFNKLMGTVDGTKIITLSKRGEVVEI